MKSLFLATAAVAAFAAAPAFAQDAAGSIGVAYSNQQADLGGTSADGDGVTIDANFAVPITGSWTVTLDGVYAQAFDAPAQVDDTTVAGRVHASTTFGDMRIGAFAGGTSLTNDESLWSFGAEAQKYMGKMTLTGSVAYETVESTDADIWSVGGDVAYFVSPNFRVNGGLGYTTVDAGGLDLDGWKGDVGAEYQLPGTAISVVGNYNHAELNDVDLDVDTFTVGFRFGFGGDLQARERSGADLGRTAAGVGGLAGLL